MAAFHLFMILFFTLSINAISAQQRRSTIISLGSSLTPTPTGNSTWLSPSGLYAFGFFPVNTAYVVAIFLSSIQDKTVVWTADMGSPSVSSDATLQLTSDGMFVRQQRGGQDVQIANPTMSITSASMLDNGNFVLYNNNSTVVWQSFDEPTNTLLPGQRLSQPRPQELFSSASGTDYTRGLFRIKMQSDGNLVQYPVNTDDTAPNAYYASDTNGQGSNVSLNLESNGHLYLYNESSILQNLTGGYPTGNSTIYLFRIDLDGIARLYTRSLTEGDWDVKWESITDRCGPKGLCGFNSFCFVMDVVTDCKCLPGFDPIQSHNKTAGCARYSTAPVCSNKNSEEMLFEMREENTVWDDDSYDALNGVSKDGCISICLNDCNCDAAFFKDGNCRKQRLPLRYGRRSQSKSDITLVKVTKNPSSPAGVSDKSGKEIKKELRVDILGISIALIVISALFLVISIVYIKRKHGTYKKLIDQGDARLDDDVSLQVFSYADLARATNDFGEELGKGASSTVFKGILHSCQRVVAVKMLEKECGERKEFQTEIKTIGKTYHRNLVRLLGYCLDGPKKLLVLEYMSNGSLGNLLFNPDKRPSWEARIKIARDIARGILYLHEECETQIIHCDIKSQNILLDELGCAKISDFGIAKLLKQDQTKTYTGIRGTKGYVAPEWHRNQAITVKADVYSYGIVLLEIICCRKSINWNLSEDEAVLEEWVYNCYEARELENLVGDEIVEKRKVERVVKIGLGCIQNEPSLRPSMKKVLLMLEGTVDIPVPPNPSSFLSSTD